MMKCLGPWSAPRGQMARSKRKPRDVGTRLSTANETRGQNEARARNPWGAGRLLHRPRLRARETAPALPDSLQ
jgi:hypothetical protein